MEKKLFGHRFRKHSAEHERPEHMKGGKVKDSPPDYEGKEHVKYKDPGHTSHEIDMPEDEPHMKSHVSRNEEHEMEDQYEMGVPHQTKYDLPAKIARARMKMDAPDQEDPDELMGNITHNVPLRGEEDTTAKEEMGPNEMQKESRKKMIVAVMKRKMRHRTDKYNKSLDEEVEK